MSWQFCTKKKNNDPTERKIFLHITYAIKNRAEKTPTTEMNFFPLEELSDRNY